MAGWPGNPGDPGSLMAEAATVNRAARMLKRDDPDSRAVQSVPRLALTPREAAEALGTPEPTLRDLMRRGDLAFTSYGRGRHKGRYLLAVEDLRAWLARNRTPARWERIGANPATPHAPGGESAARHGACS